VSKGPADALSFRPTHSSIASGSAEAGIHLDSDNFEVDFVKLPVDASSSEWASRS